MSLGEPWVFPEIRLSLPEWVGAALPPPGHRYATDGEKMGLAIALSRLNIEHGTGGPFGAAVFEATSNTLLAPGVNLVQQLGWSGAHAEMVALAMAHKRLGQLDLGADRQVVYELFSSTEPCAMCMGGILWSGIGRLVCGATDRDAQAIGFDEGIKASDWVEQFRRRGMDVKQGVCREEAVSVLNAYQRQGGLIYNGGGAVRPSDCTC
jgi:tRNA(Arg) A34 adenosine deaminase TadA